MIPFSSISASLRDRAYLRVGAIVAVLAGLMGVSLAVFPSSDEKAQSYREVPIKRGPISVTLVATGVVQPQNRVAVKPPINGRVEEVLAAEGKQVKRGQILAWMSSTERAALLDAARAKGPAEVKEWEELYRPTPILAPIDGTIIQQNVQPGQSFTSADAVFVISDRLTVKTLVDETDIAQIRPGQAAMIVLDAYSDTKIPGIVDTIAFDGKTINSITTYEVDVVPHGAPAYIRSAMTANVTFEIAAKKEALLVPAEAIRTHEGHSTVLVPSSAPGLGPSTREITIGLSDGKYVEARGGLSGTEKLLIPEGNWEKDSNPRAGLYSPPRKSGGP